MTGRALRAVLRLYPAAYRRAGGEEIAGVYEAATAGAGWVTRLVELAGIAGYGLRMRCGLTFGGLHGRLLAVAAPFAAGAVLGGSALSSLLYWYANREFLPGAVTPELVLAHLAALLALPAAAAVLLGRWSTARLLTPTVMVVSLMGRLSWRWWAYGTVDPHSLATEVLVLGLPSVLWCLMLLAAPRDVLGGSAPGRAAGLLAGIVLGGVGLQQLMLTSRLPGARFTGPMMEAAAWFGLAMLVAALPALRRGVLFPAAVVLAGAPMVLLPAYALLVRETGGEWTGPGAMAALVVLVLAALAAGRVLGLVKWPGPVRVPAPGRYGRPGGCGDDD
ncbi:hypothetical protein [Kitasatospora camelliae]|uniref:Uncharacterized protein n=1 Tax=Kitasatospora camelliae TaxID=3156397 RepID=A0AAU8JYK1_9ACTN